MAHQAWDYRCEARTRKLGVGGVGAWDRDVPGLLAGLGEEGWELVTVVAESGAWGPGQAGVTTGERWVFKRPRQG